LELIKELHWFCFFGTVKAVQVAMNALRFQDLTVCDTMLACMLQLFQAALCPLYK